MSLLDDFEGVCDGGIQNLVKAYRVQREALFAIYSFVQRQAGDDRLWLFTDRNPTVYIQQGLRKLHHSVESNYWAAIAESDELLGVLPDGYIDSVKMGPDDFEEKYRCRRTSTGPEEGDSK